MPFSIDPNNFDSCPQFNDWLDQQHADQYGDLDIFSFQPRPSFVLHQLSFTTYEAVLADFLSDREEQIKQTVYNDFPSPVAYYFYRFENGYENELQRLHFLRDTWEALIDLLHALTVGECRYHRLSLAASVRFSDLLSDRMADRLLNVERLINLASGIGTNLAIGSIASGSTLDTMRELNRTRNAFSHSAAQSETQAREWVAECYQDVIDVLEELKDLAHVSVFRYLSQDDAMTLRCEYFKGHAFTKTIRRVTLDADQARLSQRYFRQGELLVLLQDVIFSLKPFLYFREDSSGHATRLCMFRKTKGDAPDRFLEFEVVGDATRWDQDRNQFRSEIDELRSLFGLGPD